LRACARGAGVFDDGILPECDPRGLLAHEGRLVGWDRFGVDDVLSAELSVEVERRVEVEARVGVLRAAPSKTFEDQDI
jgi:hypothetical protein